MPVNRWVEKIVKFTLDECFPPFLRDNKVFMSILLNMIFRDKAHHFLDFKEKMPSMSKEDIQSIYRDIRSVQCSDETDLSSRLLEKIIKEAKGRSVLDVGCGKGVLADHLSRHFIVGACDVYIEKESIEKYKNVAFREADIHKLPYADNEFDTVVSTHTLEHVSDLHRAVQELRRVAKKRLIIVVPKERPYQYSFNLHLHFFPYRYSVIQAMKQNMASLKWEIEAIDGCWYYREDIESNR
jgi:ubiquinone/menaquinone biosynthesis C-methylase UbiE